MTRAQRECCWGFARASAYVLSMSPSAHVAHTVWLRVSMPASQDGSRSTQSISFGMQPNAIVGLDKDTAVIGFESQSPLQVWNLATRAKVRDFEGSGRCARSLTTLPSDRLAVSWHTGSQWAVTIYDVKTGKRMQDLTGFSGEPQGLAYAGGHLLTTCTDGYMRVWSIGASEKVSVAHLSFARGVFFRTQSSAAALLTPPLLASVFMSQFEQKASHNTARAPFGRLSVLSPSTVAFGTNSSTVEIWDWKAGKQLHSLGGFSSIVYGTARLPDGRLLAVGHLQIKIGSPDNWSAATTLTNHGYQLFGVVAAQDGSFVTADSAAHIKLWRDGSSRVLSIHCHACYYGSSMAIVGSRLISGHGHNLYLAE